MIEPLTFHSFVLVGVVVDTKLEIVVEGTHCSKLLNNRILWFGLTAACRGKDSLARIRVHLTEACSTRLRVVLLL